VLNEVRCIYVNLGRGESKEARGKKSRNEKIKNPEVNIREGIKVGVVQNRKGGKTSPRGGVTKKTPWVHNCKYFDDVTSTRDGSSIQPGTASRSGHNKCDPCKKNRPFQNAKKLRRGASYSERVKTTDVLEPGAIVKKRVIGAGLSLKLNQGALKLLSRQKG